ncbi:MAG: N-acetylglucosamine-6-phosphate deacetylase [Mycobacteriales bacterium]
MILLAGASVVLPGAVLRPGWVGVSGGTIAAVGEGGPPAADGAVVDLGGGYLLPGYVDLHVHGGGGGSIDASPEGLAAAVATHRSHGTTRTLASVVTAPVEAMADAVRRIAAAVHAGPTPDGHVVGAHLEGPFLARERAGAQNPEAIIDPDPRVLQRLLDAAGGTARMVTVAPELPGAIDVIRAVVDAGAVAAIGHTDATYAQASAGIRAGARVLTHAFNGTRPLHHREPGPVGAVLGRPDDAAVREVDVAGGGADVVAGVVAEAINDGIHLHDATLWLLHRCLGHRLCFVTDAMAAAGLGDGDYEFTGRTVTVRGGRASLAGNGVLVGSTPMMDRPVARAVNEVGLPIEVAARAAATTPAGVLGGAGRFGAVAAGLDADLVVLDDDLAVRRVMALGRWVR